MSWVMTDYLDISFQHCNRPAFWDNDEVYCSRCGVMLDENE
jgi:hypothetical protein